MIAKLVIPSSLNGKHSKIVCIERESLTPRINIPVVLVDRCVCCPSPVLHGQFCSILYRHAGTSPDGTMQYVRVF